MILLDGGFKKICDILIQCGYSAYAVGGCVRDLLLGKSINDIDICTDALPQQTAEIFKNDYKVVYTGLKHGTITVIVEGKPYEITTFRKDGNYLDNRHPESVEFVDDLKEDLARRDFTVNAVAINNEGELFDYFGGQTDLKNKIIRCVGDADKRFQEDALRILRALRFSSVLGFKIEEETKRAIIKNKRLLKNISAERINVEFTKLLLGDNVESVMNEFAEVIFEIIPELRPCYKFNPKSKYHRYDVYMHLINSVAQSKKNVVVRYTMLLHDIGKPQCFVLDENGVGHFYNHPIESVKIAKVVLRRLKTDKRTFATVLTLIEYHDSLMRLTHSGIKKWLRILGTENFRLLLEVQRADAKAHAEGVVEDRLKQIDESNAIFNEILESHECYSFKALAVNGYDLTTAGYKGVEVGVMLENLLDKVISGELKNDKKTLLDYVKKEYEQ